MNSTYDVIVVGAGNAALCAALSAQQEGASVLILERASKELRGGNSAFSGAGMRFVYHGAEDIRRVVPDRLPDPHKIVSARGIRTSQWSTRAIRRAS